MVLDPAMQDWRAVIGRNVRKIRQQRRMTQEKLAFEAEIDLTHIGGIERGKRNPGLLVMARVAARPPSSRARDGVEKYPWVEKRHQESVEVWRTCPILI
jgi:transcriptional regulator with XRE-family HTH domain